MSSNKPPFKGANVRYHVAIRYLHWIMAVGIFLMYILGTRMDEVPAGDAHDSLMRLHISVGISLIVLMILRIVARWWTRIPPLPPDMSPRERKFARIGHMALYGVIVLGLSTGWLEAEVSEYGTAWFGQRIPGFVPEDGIIVELSAVRVIDEIHMFLADILMILVVGHIGYVIKHQWFDRHDILGRMFKNFRLLRRAPAPETAAEQGEPG